VIPEATQILLRTFVALCLGALVGLERQVAQEESGDEKDFPGVRTLAFVALLGALSVLVTHELGPWLGVALFVIAAAFLIMRYWYDASERGDPGYTTEIAGLCTFAVGALAQSGQLLIATVITIVMVALLRSKRAVHRAGELLSSADMEALIRFLAIILVVWPLLPERALPAPLEVLRPRDVWRMVVLISGLSFGGYVLTRLRIQRSSHLLAGFLGGLVSSTATAFAYARLGRASPRNRIYEALIVLAAAATYLRMTIEVGLVAPQLLPGIALPIGVMALVGAILVGWLSRRGAATDERPGYVNPLTLRVALSFAAIYALVLLLADWARTEFATAGLYAVSAIAAVTGADAPTLSLARLASDAAVADAVAVRGIGIVAISTTLAKGGILIAVAGGAFAARVAATLGVMALAGAAALWWATT
jgi:uncharacterized membrane protein (DUF4010 family)